MVHVDNEGIIDGLWRGDMKFTGPKGKDAGLWILIREGLHTSSSRGHTGGGVEHVKAHRSKKEKNEMTLFDMCD